ncbi:MAG: tetratricopeptide repeat protein, partial [Phycisphaerae bacterium]
KALLYLADAALKAELYDDAVNTYSRVYNIDYSLESRMAAAFGAARATFAKNDYAETEIWLTKYLNLATQYSDSELHQAYLMLGKAQLRLDKRTKAFNAFKLALNEELTTKDRSDIITALLKCDLDKLDPIPAFDLIETLQMQGLSPQEYTEAVLMNCRILRKIHLPQKALAILNDRFDYIIEPQLRASAYYEAGLCYIDLEQIENARGCFTRLLSIAEPGLLADKTSLKLAELSLKLNKDEKAVEICTRLLERNDIPDDLRKSTVNTLAQAYKKQNDYQKAIQLLVEQNSGQTTDERTVSDLKSLQNQEQEEL